MKKRKIFKGRALVGTAVLLFILSVLIGCGGSGSGGGGDGEHPTGSSNWGTLIWDQDNWR